MNRNQYFIRTLFLLLFLGAFSFPALGQQSPVKNNDPATRLIHKLQIDLTGAQSGVRQLLKRNFFNLPEQKNKKLKQAFNEGYNNKSISDIFKDSLQKKVTPELRKEVSNWLDRPSTEAVVQANLKYNTLQGKRKRVTALYKLDHNPVTPARKQVLTQLWSTKVDLSQATTVAMIMLRSMIKAYDKLNDNRHYSDEKIDQIAQNYKNRVLRPSEQAAKKRGVQSLAVKYYNVSTKDLKAYSSFLNSHAGQSLITAIAKSTQAAYEAGSQRFLNLIKKSITQ